MGALWEALQKRGVEPIASRGDNGQVVDRIRAAHRRAAFDAVEAAMKISVTEKAVTVTELRPSVTELTEPVTKKRGPAKSGNALSAADKQRAYRERKKTAPTP